MNGDKQIEEIYRTLLDGCNGIECFECEGKDKKDGCLHYHNAHALYNAGYRKASEVALETIGEVIAKAKAIFCPHCDYDVSEIRYNLDWLEAVLKEKYTEEVK